MDNEITYDVILKYLVTDSYNFSNSINIQSDILKTMFKYKDDFPYKKTGVNKNNSLISSILYLLESDYKILLEEEQNKLNEVFYNQLKSGLKKNSNIENNEKLLAIISNVLVLNIIILDFKNDNYYIESGSEKINKYKNFIIIAKNDKDYEPVSNGDKKIFTVDELTESVINNINKNSYSKDEILKMEGYKVNVENNTFKINLEEYNKTKLNKMKKDQLINIVNMLKLEVSDKDTKNTIIDLILNYKKS
jgi:hypothetical protein